MEVYAGIAGAHIRSLNSNGIVAIEDNEVSEEDIDRVIDAAQAVAIPTDQKLLHIFAPRIHNRWSRGYSRSDRNVRSET